MDTCTFLTLDGITVPGRFLFGEGVATREGVRASGNTERPFVFQKIVETGGAHFLLMFVNVALIHICHRFFRPRRINERIWNDHSTYKAHCTCRHQACQLYPGLAKGGPGKKKSRGPFCWVLKATSWQSTADPAVIHAGLVKRPKFMINILQHGY